MVEGWQCACAASRKVVQLPNCYVRDLHFHAATVRLRRPPGKRSGRVAQTVHLLEHRRFSSNCPALGLSSRSAAGWQSSRGQSLAQDLRRSRGRLVGVGDVKPARHHQRRPPEPVPGVHLRSLLDQVLDD